MANTNELERKSIQLALNHKWSESIKLNEKILEADPENLPALNRLARALIETGKPAPAKKYLKQVLTIDPLNKTAQKNLDLAKKSKRGHKHNKHEHLKEDSERKAVSFIHEPGTTKQVEVKISEKDFTAKSFHTGDKFYVKMTKDRISLHREGKFVGYLSLDEKQKDLIKLIKSGESVTAVYKNGSRGKITVIIKTKTPIFKTEKQEVRPYAYHKDDRPDIEIPIEE